MKDGASGRNCAQCVARDIAYRTQYKKADSRGTDVGDTSSVAQKSVQEMQHLETRLLKRPQHQVHRVITSYQAKLLRVGKKTGSSSNDEIEFLYLGLAPLYALLDRRTSAFFTLPTVLRAGTSSCTAQQGLMRSEIHRCAHELIRMQLPSNTTVNGGRQVFAAPGSSRIMI